MKPFLIGTRASPLALAQTRQVAAALTAAWPGREIVLREIRTEGDRLSAGEIAPGAAPLGKGLFTGELEAALRRGEIDLAVHSLKDLPTVLAPDLVIAGVPARADARDLLFTRNGAALDDLPPGATVATGSPRRQAQLLRARPDLQVVAVRGNIETRLRKLRENRAWHGLVLAAAGLERLQPATPGLVSVFLPLTQMLPAPGQGALGLQTRADAPETIAFVHALHDPASAAQVAAERAFLRALGGGCEQPIAAYAHLSTLGELEVHGLAWLNGEPTPRVGQARGEWIEAEALGGRLATQLLAGSIP